MSATVSYPCPCCDAGLIFSPDKDAFVCEFCLSEFTKAELDKTASAKRAEEKAAKNEEFNEQMLEYSCPSCGAEVMADTHTASTHCYYCHNPVVLVGKLSGALRPSKIIPFAFSRDVAKEKFLEFVKKYKFLPRDYYCAEQIEKITGVYYPFWVTDADVTGSYRTTAHRSTSWRSGDYIYTKISNYNIERDGRIHFEDIVSNALSTEDTKMLEGILPFPSDSHRDFDMAYLLGTVSKKRDTERDALSASVREKMREHATSLFDNTVSGYAGKKPPTTSVNVQSSHWEYTLMPVWTLTYREKKGKTYLFAMNGHTGKIYGELPVSFWKLLILFGSVLLSVALVLFFLLGL